MLTTIGEKIIEIRPKQIIESNQEIKNPYLRLIKDKNNNSSPKRGRPKVEKNEQLNTEHSSPNTETNT